MVNIDEIHNMSMNVLNLSEEEIKIYMTTEKRIMSETISFIKCEKKFQSKYCSVSIRKNRGKKW